MPGLHDAGLDGLHEGGGNVHDHEALTEIAGIGAQAHDVELELAQADFGRHVHRRERRAVDGAGRVETVAGLEAADAGFDVGIVDRRLAGGRIEVTREDEPLAQRHHVGALDADAQPRAHRQGRPTALRRERAVPVDHLLRRRERLRRQDGCRRTRHAAAGGALEILLPLGLLREHGRRRGEDEGERSGQKCTSRQHDPQALRLLDTKQETRGSSCPRSFPASEMAGIRLTDGIQGKEHPGQQYGRSRKRGHSLRCNVVSEAGVEFGPQAAKPCRCDRASRSAGSFR